MATENEKIGDDNLWRTHAYRQAMVHKIKLTIQESGVQFRTYNSSEIENYIYTKVNTRHEYLITIAQFILHLKKKALQVLQLTSGGSIDLSDLTEAANALQDFVL